MNNCIFCKIANKDKLEEIIYENNKIVVFRDINPKAPIHLLVTPKMHYREFYEMMKSDSDLIKEIGEVITILVDKFNLKDKPYTWGFHAGVKQSVNHIHAQLLSGFGAEEYVL